jgi:hypothetical protein
MGTEGPLAMGPRRSDAMRPAERFMNRHSAIGHCWRILGERP